jgi:Ni/Co efflux regulator RcnB
MQNMKRALTLVLVVSVAAAPCSLAAEDTGAGRSNAQPADVVVDTSERPRAGLKMLRDDQLGELVARAEAKQAASAASGGGGHKKRTLIIVGASVVVAVLLFAAIRESCKKQGAECLKK